MKSVELTTVSPPKKRLVNADAIVQAIAVDYNEYGRHPDARTDLYLSNGSRLEVRETVDQIRKEAER